MIKAPLFIRSIQENVIQYCIIFFTCLLGYWPLSFSVFSVKNDAINYFLPFRYNISCAIRSGEFPFWSPYIYLGYPMQGDMQSGAWNPIVWIISIITRYDLTIFHIEYLLYIFLSGISMYLLTGLISQQKNIRLFAAIAYMLSGYLFGSGQFINWIASAAFVPFVLYFYFIFLSTGKSGAAIKSGACYWLLFVCGYPADLIYVFYVLLAMLITAGISARLNNRITPGLIKGYAVRHLLMIIVFLGLSAPAIISYVEFLPYYARGGGITFAEAMENSFELKNFISFLNPWPTWANDFFSETDPTGRNIFTGLVTVCLFIYALFSGLERTGKFLLGLFLFSLLFSVGHGFLIRGMSFHLLPGMNTFRHPSHFRLFAVIPMVLLAVIGLNKIASQGYRPSSFKWVCFSLMGVFVLTIAFCISKGAATNFLQLIPGDFQNTSLKNWLDSVDGSVLGLAGSLIQILFLGILLLPRFQKKFFVERIIVLNFLNLFIFQCLFPVNFVSKTSPSVINRLIHEVPTEFDKNQVGKSLIENSTDALAYYDQVGLYYFYNKKVGISRITNSPSFLSSQLKFVEDPFLFHYISQQPLIFLSDSSAMMSDSMLVDQNKFCYTFIEKNNPALLSRQCIGGTNRIADINVRYNEIETKVQLADSCMINLLQNFHHDWKVYVDGIQQPIYRANGAFMSTPLSASAKSVKWKFTPVNTIAGMAIALFTILFLFFRVIFRNKPNR